MARPVYGITVLRLEDGTTELVTALDRCPSGISIESCDALPMPESWEDRHAMLIDALAEVKRQAGVTHGRPFWEEAPDDGK